VHAEGFLCSSLSWESPRYLVAAKTPNGEERTGDGGSDMSLEWNGGRARFSGTCKIGETEPEGLVARSHKLHLTSRRAAHARDRLGGTIWKSPTWHPLGTAGGGAQLDYGQGASPPLRHSSQVGSSSSGTDGPRRNQCFARRRGRAAGRERPTNETQRLSAPSPSGRRAPNLWL